MATPYTLKEAYDHIWSGKSVKLIYTPKEKEQMKKVITNLGSASHNVNFQPEGIKTHTAPVITGSYIYDEGKIIHTLENGNELSDENYIKHWGIPKGVINWKAKDHNPDTRKRF